MRLFIFNFIVSVTVMCLIVNVCYIEEKLNKFKDSIKVCSVCGNLGLKNEMIKKKEWDKDRSDIMILVDKYYHPDCYAEKFNKVKNPLGTDEWVDKKDVDNLCGKKKGGRRWKK